MIASSTDLVRAQHPNLSEVIFTDTIPNGSFEGDQYIPAPGPKPMPPPPWIWCNWGANSPDLQPGYWLVTVPPFDGYRYAGMISKFEDENRIYHENFAIPLRFDVNEDQFLMIHLANNLIQNNRDASEGGRLRLILREFEYCLHEEDPGSDTIWTSEVIQGETWQPQFINFSSPIEEGFLVFEAVPARNTNSAINFSNILIDGVSGPFSGKFAKPDLGADTTICAGDSVVKVLPGLNPRVSITWNDGDTLSNKTFKQAGIYSVTIQFKGFTYSDTIAINVRKPFELELEEDGFFCREAEFYLGPDHPAYEWEWSDGITGSPRRLTESGNYILRGTDGACRVIDSVSYAIRSCEIELSMPNVFTPNGDDIHDVFQPMVAENIFSYQLQILDRWGRVMANIGEISGSWDGTDMNGRPAPEGVYFYSVRYQGLVSEEVQAVRGAVTLMR